MGGQKNIRTGIDSKTWAVITISFTLLSILIFELAQAEFERLIDISPSNYLSTCCAILLSSLMLGFSLSSTPQQLNMSLFWSFQYYFFGIVPLCTFLDPFPFFLSKIASSESKSTASNLVLMAECVVAFVQLHISSKNKLGDYRTVGRNSLPINFIKRLKLLALIYLFVLPFIIRFLGGSSFFFKKIRIQSSSIYTTTPQSFILYSIILVVPLILYLSLLYIGKHRLARTNKLILISLFLWLIILANPFGNARQVTLFLAFPILFFLLNGHRLLCQLFFLILPIGISFSSSPINRYTGAIQVPRFVSPSRLGDYDAFAQFANSINLVSDSTFPLMRQILGSVFFFVPRSLWTSKPNDTGIELGRLLGLHFQNLSAPWLAEAYVNARIPGVIIVSGILASFLTRLDLALNRDLKHFLSASVISGALFIVLRGSLLQATGRIVFALILIALLFWDSKPISRSPKPAPPP